LIGAFLDRAAVAEEGHRPDIEQGVGDGAALPSSLPSSRQEGAAPHNDRDSVDSARSGCHDESDEPYYVCLHVAGGAAIKFYPLAASEIVGLNDFLERVCGHSRSSEADVIKQVRAGLE
jgi:hypothetical protein